MGLSKETLALLGLSENATDEEINAKVSQLHGEKTKVEQERDRFKTSFDKTATEYANFKKEKMTDEEKKQAEEQELKDKLAQAELEIKLNKTEKEYLGVGMDNETASKMARAVLDGNLEQQGLIMKEYTENVAKKAKAEALKQQPDVNAGDAEKANTGKYTKENFKKGLISMEEMNQLKVSNPTLYNEILGKK